MARGRMIANEITKDKDINQLSSDLSRLAFTWLITFADVEGRTYGDPALVRSMLFPRRDDITIAQVEAFIQEWHDVGLVVWYEAQGDLWIFFPNFHKHQQLRRDKEAPSHIPAPPQVQPTPDPIDVPTPPEGRSNGGVEAELPDIKLKEVKRIEVEGNSAAATPSFFSPQKVEALIFRVASMAIPPGEYNRIEQIHTMVDVHGEAKVEEALRVELKEWVSTKNKNGRPYPATNFAWVDKAQARLFEQDNPVVSNKPTKDMTQAEYVAWLHQQAEALDHVDSPSSP